MPSLPNEFIPYANNTMNQNDFVPIQINRNETRTVQPTFVTSGNTNHANLFSPSPPFTSYHAPQVYPSTLTFNSPRMAYPTRSNMVSAVRMPQISGFVHSQFSPVLVTPTMPNMYHATVRTNNMVTRQNGHDRGQRVITSGQTIWNHSPNVSGQATPTMPNMYHRATFPTSNMVTRQNGHDRGQRVMTSGQTIWNHSPNVSGQATPTMPNMYHHATVPANNMVTRQNGHDRGQRVLTSGQTIWNHSPNVSGQATPTMPNMYHHATVPANNMVTRQNGHDRGQRVITSGQTIWNHSPNVSGMATPTMPNMSHHVMVPTNNMVTSQNGHERVITSDPTISPPNVFNNQRGTFYREPIDYTKGETSNEGGENKYRTHSMPNENNGSYMCPKCHSLFDISPIISAARMGSVHAGNETNQEEEKGPCARPKKRCREQKHQDVNGKARKLESEDKVPEESCCDSDDISDSETN